MFPWIMRCQDWNKHSHFCFHGLLFLILGFHFFFSIQVVFFGRLSVLLGLIPVGPLFPPLPYCIFFPPVHV